MRKLLFATLATVFLLSTAVASATTYTYVGSYNVNDGISFGANPLAYSGVGAAALLFGGSPSDYVISTNDSDPNDINFSAWYNVIGVGSQIFGDTYFRGTEGTTHYQDVWTDDPDTDTVSAYVSDFGDPITNFVFTSNGAAPTPEPGSLALLSTGLLGFGATLRRRFNAAR